jgi:septal ring factor EnvC (AmiA/AmiB activator)
MTKRVTAQNQDGRPWLRRTSAGLCLTAFVLAGQGGLARAQTSGPVPAVEDKADPREKLEMLQRKLEQDRALQQKLDAQRAKLEAEKAQLQKDLVAAADQVRAREAEQIRAEAEHARLSSQERVAESAFYEQRAQLAGLLAVLQRMGREPPPALLVQPENAVDAARSAMVLTAVLPGVRQEAQKLSAALTRLRDLRQAAAKTRVTLALAGEALQLQRARIDALLAVKRQLAVKTAVDLNAAKERVQVSAQEVANVEQLIRRVSGEFKELSDGGFGAASFASLRGRLKWPANGQIVANFGDDNELGVRNTAITLKTRPNAQVVSPVDGKIKFAGPFAGYGNLLIIAAGDDYHVVLFGMSDIFGAEGQALLSGEPVGRMGGETVSAEGDRLNIEIRRGRDPVDPKPWFSGADGIVRDKGHG